MILIIASKDGPNQIVLVLQLLIRGSFWGLYAKPPKILGW
jgi:hypothetical protein